MSVKGRARPASGPARVLEIQRSRILAAMVEESAARGAANVSVGHVVSCAGVSRRTFYEIFNDREDCFLAAFDEGIARASRYVLASYDPVASWLERIRTILGGLLAFLDAEPDTGELLVVGSLGAGPETLERRRRVLARAIATVDEGRSETSAGKDLPTVTAEGVVGGVLSVIHSRLLDGDGEPFIGLAGPLTSMLVLPYMGAAAARRELGRTASAPPRPQSAPGPDPLRQLGMRLTYRTIRVLMAVAATPGGSNRQVADESGIGDQGQISKLLARLHGLGLIENTVSTTRGAPNSWVLTDRGWEVQTALASR